MEKSSGAGKRHINNEGKNFYGCASLFYLEDKKAMISAAVFKKPSLILTSFFS